MDVNCFTISGYTPVKSIYHMVQSEGSLCADTKTDVLGPTAKACNTLLHDTNVGAIASCFI